MQDHRPPDPTGPHFLANHSWYFTISNVIVSVSGIFSVCVVPVVACEVELNLNKNILIFAIHSSAGFLRQCQPCIWETSPLGMQVEEADKGCSEFCITVGAASRTAGMLIHTYLEEGIAQDKLQFC